MHDDPIIIKSELDRTSVRIILGLEEQFMQISRFCNISGSDATVLGIDRTFDLSSMYATITVFKQLDLIRPRTTDNPIMLSPILLSFDATKNTYKYFLTQLKWKLKDLELQGFMFYDANFIVGSNQKKHL